MCHFPAELELRLRLPPQLIRCLIPELESSERARVKLEFEDGDSRLIIAASDPSLLRAMINTWIRLIHLGIQIWELVHVNPNLIKDSG